MVEMNKISTKSHLEDDQLPIKSSTGASVEYEYDLKSMNEEYTATYYN